MVAKFADGIGDPFSFVSLGRKSGSLVLLTGEGMGEKEPLELVGESGTDSSITIRTLYIFPAVLSFCGLAVRDMRVEQSHGHVIYCTESHDFCKLEREQQKLSPASKWKILQMTRS